jgi:hypothetical protein
VANCWKDYRRIVVCDRVFYWRYEDGVYGSWEPHQIIVRLEERPTAVLTVQLQGAGYSWGTPRLVCACIERALFRGWLRDQDVMQFDHDAVEGKA